MEILRLNEVFPEWTTRGVFSYLNTFDVPWKNSATPAELDIAYHGGRSGGKIISTLVDSMLTDGQLTPETASVIAMSIMAVNGRNWSKLWDTLELDYNPIENYRMTETEQGQDENTETSTLSGSESVSSSLENSGSGQANTTGNNATNVFGFNSVDAVGSDTGTTDTETSSTQTTTQSADELRDTESTTTNTGTSTNNRTLTRSGNIGVTTSQQMIESERSLWDWYFFDVVFRDLDKMLTLSIY